MYVIYWILTFSAPSFSCSFLRRHRGSKRIAIYRVKCKAKNGRISGSEQEFVYLISVCCATAGVFCRSCKVVDFVVHWCTESFSMLGLSQQQRKMLIFYQYGVGTEEETRFNIWAGEVKPQLHKFALALLPIEPGRTPAKVSETAAKRLGGYCVWATF